MNNQIQVYKITNGKQKTYYYYTEKNVYVTTMAYCCAFNIIFGTMWICYNVSKWHFYGIDMACFHEMFDAFLVFAWLFLVRWNYRTLKRQAYKVQVLKGTVIEDKDGNKIENWCN